MVEARIIQINKNHSSGSLATWFEIETIYSGKPHRSSDHAYSSEEAARETAAKEADDIDPTLYVEDR